MSQHIGIHITDEKNEVIKKTSINFAEVRNVTEDHDDYLMINQIDPYGTTYINFFQKEKLVLEIKKLLDSPSLTSEVVETIKQSLDEFRDMQNYQFIKFIGD